ncbi:Type IV pilus biogenesis and competence protein PilQ [subsurface metagenome]
MVLLNDKFESGTIMRNLMKLRGIKFLTILMVVMLAWTVVIAEQTDIAEQADKEILTELEQQMQKRISVNFSNTPIDDVIRIIADQANMNIIKSPKVVGDVTATLTEVPLEEVLNNILTLHGYSYVVDRNMIRVAPLEDIATVDERLISRTYRIYYADVTEIEKALSKFVSKRGSLSFSPATSNIIVTDTETKIKAIDKFIEEIDRITPQILVEVRIYDITTDEDFDLGIEWNVGRNSTERTSVTVPDSTSFGVGMDTTVGDSTSTRGERQRTSTPFVAGSYDELTGGSIRFGILNDAVDIDIALNILHEQDFAKLLANPRIMVLDNETATFEIIREIPYTERTTTSAGSDTQTVQFKEVGVKLKVTPHVTRDSMVRLHIQPEFGVRVGTGSGTPTVDTRKLDTIALVKDNQTVVLGGLRKNETTQDTWKVPLFGDIPLLGGLFRSETESIEISELVIFITPRIITQPVLSETERQQLEVTEFSGPKPASTWIETSKK